MRQLPSPTLAFLISHNVQFPSFLPSYMTWSRVSGRGSTRVGGVDVLGQSQGNTRFALVVWVFQIRLLMVLLALVRDERKTLQVSDFKYTLICLVCKCFHMYI